MKKAPLLIILGVLLVVLGVFLIVRSAPPKIPAPAPAPQPAPAPAPQPEPVNAEDAIKLAEKFAPIIYLKGEGDAPESYEPEQIEIFIDDAVVRDIQNPTFTTKASLASLPQWSKSDYYLDLADLAPKAQSPTDYRLTYDQLKGRYEPTVYVRIRENVDGYTIIQYWLFYYANDWRNFHEGDWELVQVHLPPQSPGKLLEEQTLPIFVALSQHQFGQQMSWNDMAARSLVENGHPVVYVARGSHANYFLPGTSWAVLDFDDTGITAWQTMQPGQYDIALLPEEGEMKPGLDWVDFRGRWGEYLGLSLSVMGMSFTQAGPFGPLWVDGEKKSDKWEKPVQWASGLPTYPDPFWKGFLKMLPDPSKMAIFSIFSPADLHVYDVQGRHVGLTPSGQVETGIPGAIYLTVEGADYKTVIIPNADVAEQYRVEAKGTGTGKMDLRASVPDAQLAVKRFLEYLNVPITPSTTARTSVKPAPAALLAAPRVAAPELRGRRLESIRDEAAEIEIDSDGDGDFEVKKRSGDYEKREEIRREEERKEEPPKEEGKQQPSGSAPPLIQPRFTEIPETPDFYFVKITERQGEDYIAEVRDSTITETAKVTLKYQANFAGPRIGEAAQAGGQRAPQVVGQTFEIKGALRLKDGTLEVSAWKQNEELLRAVTRYREGLSVLKRESALASEASAKYNSLFTGLGEGKCVYREAAIPEVKIAWPPYTGLASPDRLAREVETGFGAISGVKDSLARMAEQVGQLKVQDCRDDLKELREDKSASRNMMTALESALDDIEGALARMGQLLEQGMAP